MTNLNQLGPELNLNERINLRGLVSAWLRINLDRFREDLGEKLYGRRRSPRKRPLQRTYQLRNNWRMALDGSGDDVRGAQYSFLLYGRMVDMGVGKGTDYALATYQRNRKNGEKRTRVPVRWYSRRKGYELHRLRELLAQHYVTIPIEALESALTARVAINV